jgi:uncharacterized RDD family membrane protein YckC
MAFAGFWDRAQAKVIDGIVLSVFLLPFDIAFGTSFVAGSGGFGRTTAGQALVLALFVVYTAVMDSSHQQATFGKRALGIIVTDLDGKRMSFHRALSRSAMQIIWFGSFLAAFTARKQGLHDLLADTQVLRGTL